MMTTDWKPPHRFNFLPHSWHGERAQEVENLSDCDGRKPKEMGHECNQQSNGMGRKVWEGEKREKQIRHERAKKQGMILERVRAVQRVSFPFKRCISSPAVCAGIGSTEGDEMWTE